MSRQVRFTEIGFAQFQALPAAVQVSLLSKLREFAVDPGGGGASFGAVFRDGLTSAGDKGWFYFEVRYWVALDDSAIVVGDVRGQLASGPH